MAMNGRQLARARPDVLVAVVACVRPVCVPVCMGAWVTCVQRGAQGTTEVWGARCRLLSLDTTRCRIKGMCGEPVREALSPAYVPLVAGCYEGCIPIQQTRKQPIHTGSLVAREEGWEGNQPTQPQRRKRARARQTTNGPMRSVEEATVHAPHGRVPGSEWTCHSVHTVCQRS